MESACIRIVEANTSSNIYNLSEIYTVQAIVMAVEFPLSFIVMVLSFALMIFYRRRTTFLVRMYTYLHDSPCDLATGSLLTLQYSRSPTGWFISGPMVELLSVSKTVHLRMYICCVVCGDGAKLFDMFVAVVETL